MNQAEVALLSDIDLIDSADRLSRLFSIRCAAEFRTDDVEKAHALVAAEMRKRKLIYEPLTKKKKNKGKFKDGPQDPNDKYAAENDGDMDGDGDLASGGADDDGDNCSEDRGKSGSPDVGSEAQKPIKPKAQPAAGGPFTGRSRSGKGGESNRTQDVAKGKGKSAPWPSAGASTKSGKGGESNRTQRGVRSGDVGRASNGAAGGVADVPSSGKSTKKGKGGNRNRTMDSVGKARIPTSYEEFSKAVASNTSTPHAFVPVRNICRICRQGQEDHVTKFFGVDSSWKDAAKIVRKAGQEMAQAAASGKPPSPNPSNPQPQPGSAAAGASVEDRMAGAQNGQALPDGSFFIPDEAALHQAVRLVAQAPDPQAAMNHIIERAKAMGLTNALPPAWNVPDAGTPAPAPMVGPGARGIAPTPPKPGNGAGSGSGGGAPGTGLMKRIAHAVSKALGPNYDEDALLAELDPHFEYAVVKAVKEDRFTLGPVYMPNTLDAHGEWATADDLQKAIHEYVRETGADRTVYLQHSSRPAGEWVEIMSWPHEVTATMKKSVDGVAKSVTTTFPAGTVYMGVKWNDWAWSDVKKGKITGFSMGGYARRVEGSPEAA